MKANKNIIIGIDVGWDGAIAMYNTEKQELKVFKMPIIKEDNKRKLDVNKLISLLNAVAHNTIICGIEMQHPFPGEGVKSVFSLGLQMGTLEAILISANIPYQYINPRKWKRFFGLESKHKKYVIKKSADLVKQLFPDFEVQTPRGKYKTGEIDAILITTYTLISFIDAKMNKNLTKFLNKEEK